MKRYGTLLLSFLILFLTGCAAHPDSAEEIQQETEIREEAVQEEESSVVEEDGAEVFIRINDAVFEAETEDNETARAFLQLLPAELEMSELNGNEKYVYLDQKLPSASVNPGMIEAGDLMLYGNNCIVLFYETFQTSYSYTRIGRIRNPEGLKNALGSGSVHVSFETAETSPDIPQTVLLNSGYEMPAVGLGTWTLDNAQAEESVYAALKTGMRLIDTARYYRCEEGVGKGILRAVDEGIVKREDVFVTSKIMPSDYDNAARAIDDSLKDLGLDYIDLMLIHQPGTDDAAVYKAMEQGVRDGKIRSIGISNYYTEEQVDEVLSFAEIMPAVIQNENHIYYQNRKLQEYVRPYGIVIESWYPFGGRGHTQESFGNETIVQIAGAHGKTPAQVILRWQIQDGYIVIPGSSNPDHIAENYDLFDFALSKEEMEKIRALDQQKRYENW